MLPEDIKRLVWASDPQLSPDGSQIAYVVTRVDDERNRYRSRVWLVPSDSSAPPRPISAGEENDASPRWSPDGRLLLFTSTRRTDQAGKTTSALYAMVTDGPGEASLLVEHDEVISGVAVSPDSRKVAYACRVRGEHYASDDIDRRPPRRIDRRMHRLNGVGFTLDRPTHVHVMSLDGDGEPLDVSPGDAEFESPSWFPDGRQLAAARTNTAERMLAGDIAFIDLDTGSVEIVTDGTGVYRSPAVGPDGTVALVGHDNAMLFPHNSKLGVLEDDGSVRWLTERLDRDWNTFPVSTAATWNANGRGLVGIVADRGAVHLRQVDLDGTITPLVTGARWVTGWSAVNGVIAFVAEDSERPGELHVLRDGHETRLTNVTDSFVRIAEPAPATRFTAPAPGIEDEVDAWIVTPRDLDPDLTYPMLLSIHGGPFTQYGDYFLDEAQLYARAGFVVVYANPRGGSGRDNDWGRCIRGKTLGGPGWGSVDFVDLMSFTDTALERFPFIDESRVGVIGGSYGGYMTSWIIGHTDRFAAACSERAVNNVSTLDIGSDIAGVAKFWFGIDALDDDGLDELMRLSPISYVDKMTTPLLIIHSDDDLRCPFDQADQLYYALRDRDHDVEYYRFPGETHELSRSGSPVHRMQRAELVIDFFTDRLGAV